MARIQGVRPDEADPITKVTYKLAERDVGRVPEPLAVMAHNRRIMLGYGALETSLLHSHRAPERLKALAEMKTATMAGCEFCLDIGSWLSQKQGVTEQQLRDLHRFRESDAFDETEKLVLEYAEGMTKTPVDVPEELFERMRRRFSEPELVELTAAAATENYRARFNWAFGCGAEGYSEGAYCARPELTDRGEATPASAGP